MPDREDVDGIFFDAIHDPIATEDQLSEILAPDLWHYPPAARKAFEACHRREDQLGPPSSCFRLVSGDEVRLFRDP